MYVCVCSHLYHVPLPRNPQKNHTSNDFGAPSRSLSLFQGNLKLTQPLKHWAESVRAPVLQPGTSTPRHGWPPLWLQHLFWGVAQQANPHKLFHAISIQVCHYQSMKSDIKHQHSSNKSDNLCDHASLQTLLWHHAPCVITTFLHSFFVAMGTKDLERLFAKDGEANSMVGAYLIFKPWWTKQQYRGL